MMHLWLKVLMCKKNTCHALLPSCGLQSEASVTNQGPDKQDKEENLQEFTVSLDAAKETSEEAKVVSVL